MKQLSIFLLLLFSACTNLPFECDESWDCVDKTKEYEESRAAAVLAWDQVIDRVSDHCYNWTKKTEVIESEDTMEFLNPDASGAAYTSRDADSVLQAAQIYLLPSRTQDKKDRTVVHEFIHVLATCEDNNGDSDHLDPLLWTKHGPDTVESIGCQGL